MPAVLQAIADLDPAARADFASWYRASMSHGPAPPAGSAATYPARRIFLISSLALFAAGLSFSLRMGIISAVESEILVAVDPARAGELSGILLGTAFSGFAFNSFTFSGFVFSGSAFNSFTLGSFTFSSWVSFGGDILFCGLD